MKVIIRSLNPILLTTQNAGFVRVGHGANITINKGDNAQHGTLSGLGGDDHPHYHTNARADERYLKQTDNIDGGTYN